MNNKTFIPAFRAQVGDWVYYICVMKYAQVARQVNFAHELGGNSELSELIQRGISSRTEDIRQYLVQSEHRFLGSLIVAAWGGDPEYLELAMEDSEGLLKGIDNGFGVLTLDGTQSYFALDGQHRLKAIKDAIKQKPSLGAEDICVLMVAHYDTPGGRERTQRLFTNINRNAKATTTSENIALDVDDAFAVTTRELLMRHDFLSQEGRVRVFSRPPASDGSFTLASGSVPVGDKRALTTISVLYDILHGLAFSLPSEIFDRTARPTDDVLERTYDTLSERLDALLASCGNVREKIEGAPDARAVRAPKAQEAKGHAFMRPVVQKAVVRAISMILDQESLTWDDILARLEALNWEIGQAPWTAVFNVSNSRMVTAKENTDLLQDLIVAHLSPRSKAEIARVRRNYREIVHASYPVPSEEMEARIVSDPPSIP